MKKAVSTNSFLKSVDEKLMAYGVQYDENARKIKLHSGIGVPLTTLKVSCKDLEYLAKCVILTANVVGFEVEVSPDSYKVSLKCGLYSTSFLLRTGESELQCERRCY